MTVFFSCLFATVAAAFAAYDWLHFFQQTHYRPNGAFWRAAQLRPARLNFVLGVCGTAAGCFGWYWSVPFWVASVGNTLFYRRKTKLKFTKRLCRLYAAVVCGAALGNLWVCGVAVPLVPLAVCVAWAVMLPLESGISLFYVQKAKRKLNRSACLKIAVVGSYAKTTVKTFLAEMLGGTYRVCATPNSYNTPLGIARTVNEKWRPTDEILIAEFGARRKGDIRTLTKLYSPDLLVYTGLAACHLQTFGSMEGVRCAKYEAVQYAKSTAVAFFQLQDDSLLPLYRKCPLKKVAVKQRAAAETTDGVTRFTLRYGGEIVPLQTTLLGSHQLQNVALAAAVAEWMHVPKEQLQKAVENLRPAPHRLEVTFQNGLWIIDDSFNANEKGVRAAMAAIRSFEGRKYVVTPGVVEQGRATQAANEAFAAELSLADGIVLCGPNEAFLRSGLQKAGYDGLILSAATPQQAVELLQPYFRTGDVLLFENDLPESFESRSRFHRKGRIQK